MLDMSWNAIGDIGAMEFAKALTQSNRTLVKLNLAANAINDHGGQRFMDSILFHHILEEVNLSQNSVSSRTCFVASQVLQNHPSMRKLDLSLNPLGEAGARSIFRTILRGLRCFVMMRHCSYGEDAQVYKHTDPTADSPYVLDLSEPYNRAIVQELLCKFQEDHLHCGFENMIYKEDAKATEVNIQLRIKGVKGASAVASKDPKRLINRVYLKNGRNPWTVPRVGTLSFDFVQSVFVPTAANTIDEDALKILQLIVENGATEIDKKMWLFLLCQDLYFTTAQVLSCSLLTITFIPHKMCSIEQAQSLIDKFKRNHIIGLEGLTVLDLLKR
jgi:hypothetical protein